MKDRTGEVWCDDRYSSGGGEHFVVVGEYDPTSWDTDEPGSVYHRVVMLRSGLANGWRESPDVSWEATPWMRRIT